MKNVLFWFIIAFCFIQTYAQNSNRERRVYKVWIALNNQEDLKGYLTALNETSVVIVEGVGMEPKEIEISSIERLKFRSKGKIGRGIAIGAGAGLALGVIGGYSSGDDEPGFLAFSAEEKAIGAGMTMLSMGAGVGAIIGALKTNFKLDGKLENYNRYRKEMNKYVLVRDHKKN